MAWNPSLSTSSLCSLRRILTRIFGWNFRLELSLIPTQTTLAHMKSLYGLKQASLNWFQKLKQNLVDQGFTPSEIDPCLYLKKNMVLLTYCDECILISPCQASIDCLVTLMWKGPKNFKLMDEGDVNKFLCVDIKKLDNNSFELSQPFLINCINSSFLGLCQNRFNTDANPSSTPVAKSLLHRDLTGKPIKYSWKYRTAVDMLSYLQNLPRDFYGNASDRSIHQPTNAITWKSNHAH